MTWAPRMFLMPVMRFRVVWGRGETIESFSPTRRFRSVDFPALGRPMSDTNPERWVIVAAVIVAGSMSTPCSEGGLRQVQPGSDTPVSPAAPSRPVHPTPWRPFRLLSGWLVQQAFPEFCGQAAAPGLEDLALASVHEGGLDRIAIVVADQVEHAVRGEQVQLGRHRNVEAAGLARGRLG